MAGKAPDIEVPRLDLQACPVEEHGLALIRLKRLPFLWHLGTSGLFGNYSLPFRDAKGQWWHQVKVGLCWPVDFFRPVAPDRARRMGERGRRLAAERFDRRRLVGQFEALLAEAGRPSTGSRRARTR